MHNHLSIHIRIPILYTYKNIYNATNEHSMEHKKNTYKYIVINMLTIFFLIPQHCPHASRMPNYTGS